MSQVLWCVETCFVCLLFVCFIFVCFTKPFHPSQQCGWWKKMWCFSKTSIFELCSALVRITSVKQCEAIEDSKGNLKCGWKWSMMWVTERDRLLSLWCCCWRWFHAAPISKLNRIATPKRCDRLESRYLCSKIKWC